VPNAEVCIELPSRAAFCKYTLQDTERFLSKDEWDNMSVGRLSLTPEDFGKYQKFIERACEFIKCTEEEKQKHKELIEHLKELTNEFSKTNSRSNSRVDKKAS
jgi:hypothetical protein